MMVVGTWLFALDAFDVYHHPRLIFSQPILGEEAGEYGFHFERLARSGTGRRWRRYG